MLDEREGLDPRESAEEEPAPADRIQTVTGDTFQSTILDGDGPIAVEFMSYGCAYCRTLEPILQQVAEVLESKGRVFRVNLPVEPELADTYGIRSTPTLVMFLDGAEVGRVEGPQQSVSSVLTAVTFPFRGRT